MGPGRRMKKQGPPPTLEQLNLPTKRKAEGSNGFLAPPQKGKQRVKLAERKRVLPEPDPKSAPKQIILDPYDGISSSDYDSDEKSPYHGGRDEFRKHHSSDPLRGASDSERDLDEADSVLDSEEEDSRPARFSEDESDGEEQLTAANIEGLSRKLDREQQEVEEDAQQELEDDALDTNIGTEEGDVPAQGLTPDLQLLRARITDAVRVLGDFRKLSDGERRRYQYNHQLVDDICIYYGYNRYLAEKLYLLFSPAEAFAFFEANESPRPVVLRTNTLRTNRRTLAQALINRGVVLEPVGKWSKVGLQVFEAPVPLGATPEYLAGHYIIQAASSFLPVMALAPEPNERILDMAAAPGGKTTYLSAMMRNTGVVFANDANKQRSKGLIGNIHRLGCKNTIVSNLEAEKSFPKVIAGFDRVLLDAPCSGTGVIGKDPSVKTSKNERDFLALPHTQKRLLLAAIDSTNHASRTGGYIVYSTCSVTIEENEQVIQYALRKRPNVTIVDTGLGNFGSEGFKSFMSKHFDDRMNLARRYYPHRENVDGFFVCKLKKTGMSPLEKNSTRSPAWFTDIETHIAPESSKSAEEDSEPLVPAAESEFGPFDSDEDTILILKAKQKRMRRLGLNPQLLKWPEGGPKVPEWM